MADKIVHFRDARTVGLIVRGKLSPSHHPDLMEQHADAILPNGAPIGFYGEGNGSSSNRVGLSMKGVVFNYNDLRIERPYYVDLHTARANRIVSTVLLITVSHDQAKDFATAWAHLAHHPGKFNLVGGNCSTHASEIFIKAGILKKGIPGLDTPDHLYAQIVRALPASSLTTESGFIGFRPNGQNGGFDMIVTPYEDSPAVNRPQPGSLKSIRTSKSA